MNGIKGEFSFFQIKRTLTIYNFALKMKKKIMTLIRRFKSSRRDNYNIAKQFNKIK